MPTIINLVRSEPYYDFMNYVSLLVLCADHPPWASTSLVMKFNVGTCDKVGYTKPFELLKSIVKNQCNIVYLCFWIDHRVVHPSDTWASDC